MKKPLLVLILTNILSVAAQPAFAIPIAFNFSFHDYVQNTNVQGYIEGLQDNSFQAATSVYVTSDSGGYGIGEYVGAPLTNSWHVTNGVIDYANFWSAGLINSPPAVTCCSLIIFAPLNAVIGALTPNAGVTTYIPDSPAVTFTPRDTSVPLPQPLLLIGAGLAALGFNRRKHPN
jgi:hypothetical protein